MGVEELELGLNRGLVRGRQLKQRRAGAVRLTGGQAQVGPSGEGPPPVRMLSVGAVLMSRGFLRGQEGVAATLGGDYDA